MKKQAKLTKSHIINIRKSIHRRLKNMKNEYDTYGDIINSLLDNWDKTHEKEVCCSPVTNTNHIKPAKEWATHSIYIHKNTKTRLDNLGKKNDTYDDLITHLLDHWDKTQKIKKENN